MGLRVGSWYKCFVFVSSAKECHDVLLVTKLLKGPLEGTERTER